jgi:hypothetical protein
MSATAEDVEVEVTETEVEEETTNENPWPETWREAITQDEKELAQLGRYKSPADVWTKARALEQRLSSGEYKQMTPFPEKGSDSEKMEWRKNNGIPESPDKYEINREVEEGDKTVIDEYLKYAYDKNVAPADVQATVDWFFMKRDQDLEAMTEEDTVAAKEVEDTLRAEWGPEYRAHMNRVEGLVDMAPGELKQSLLESRLPDGTMLRNNPDAMRFLLDMALEVNPATVVVPAAGDNIAGAIDDELNELKSLMGNKNSEYWKGAKAESMQKRYRELMEAQLKMKK